MVLALPPTRQDQLLINILASAEKLVISEKGFAPELQNRNSGVFILNQPVRSSFGRDVIKKGGDVMI